MASQGKRMVPEYLIKALENLFNSDLAVKITVGSIDHITSEDLSSLECGDIVCKEDATGKHSYIVSYKSEEGICLTYVDATTSETVSYDYIGGQWVYNSTDITPLNAQSDWNEEDNTKVSFIKNKPIAVSKLSYNESSGNIDTIAPVVETMTGYSFSSVVLTGLQISYAGVCKNGNKLTFVLAGSITKDSDTPYNAHIGKFYIPSDIMAKLYPLFEETSAIDTKVIGFFDKSSLGNNPINKNAITYQNTTINELAIQIIGLSSSLNNGSTYMFRYESTFLLSDNLISE